MKKKFTTTLEEGAINWLKQRALEEEIRTGKKCSAADIIEELIKKEIKKPMNQEIKEFIARVEKAERWDDIEAQEYRKALEEVDLDYDAYDDHEIMWDDFLEAVDSMDDDSTMKSIKKHYKDYKKLSGQELKALYNYCDQNLRDPDLKCFLQEPFEIYSQEEYDEMMIGNELEERFSDLEEGHNEDCWLDKETGLLVEWFV